MFNYASFILLDAARMGGKIEEAKTRNSTHDSLYRGGSEASLSGVAPYIFRFAYHTSFANWYLKAGWGKSWGILLKSSWPRSELHKHFRKYLIIEDDEDRQLYLRFYDPRVLRLFLPSCDAGQLREFFGRAVDYFIVEDEDPAFALRFWHENGILKSERFPVTDIIVSLPDPEPLPRPAQEELPPETVAALKQQGTFEQVMQQIQRNGSAEEDRAVPDEQPQTVAPSSPVQPVKEEATDPKVKTKWDMFD